MILYIESYLQKKTNRILINDKSKIYIDIDRTYGYIPNIYVYTPISYIIYLFEKHASLNLLTKLPIQAAPSRGFQPRIDELGFGVGALVP